MKWLYKLERKWGRFSISNLMLYIVIVQFGVYLMDMFGMGASNFLYLDIGRAVGDLQIWRFLTFIFVPPSSQPWWIVLSLLFYYFIGRSLEDAWGTFLFNAYYIIGMLGTILGAVIMYLFTGFGYGTSEYLNLSLFFAFAILYPNLEVRIFFVLPVKAKYLAMVSAVAVVINIVSAISARNWFYVVSAVAAFLNLALFFSKDVVNSIRAHFKYRKTRQNYKRQMKEWEHNQKNQGSQD